MTIRNLSYAARLGLTAAAALMLIATFAQAAPEDSQVGAVVQLRGKASIQRESSSLGASLKDPIQLRDIVQTDDASRAKLLFIDDSILTLGAKSKANIEQFVYSKEGGGASIFNLLEGNMRAVVGKTKFEVHTSTTVAAARGTIINFETGIDANGVPFTTIICLEGSVVVRSTDPNVPGFITVNAGEMVTMTMGAPIPEPQQAPEGAAAGTETKTLAGDILETTTAIIEDSGAMPPVELEPSAATTPVSVEIVFP